MSEIRLAVMGAAGRMGQALVRAVDDVDGAVIAGGTETPDSSFVGQDVAAVAGLKDVGVAITSDPIELFTKVDGVLDFTVPEASVEFAALAAQARIVHVIGTTGFNEAQQDKIKAAARHAKIIQAGNMSLGVNLIAEITRKVAATLDEEFDIEIVEMHHRQKIDAPSGTALMLGEAAAEGRGIGLKERSVRVRDGVVGPRHAGDIGFATLRGGSVIGEHTVMFAGEHEHVELTHKAVDRSIFARGGVKAALWGQNRNPGLYSMADVLGF